MKLIKGKSFLELVEETDLALLENGFDTTPGSIAKLFTDIINKNLANFYEELTINHAQSFVTTASGDYLDAIGLLLNCSRNNLESDDDYRKRITRQTLSCSMANETSLRLAILSASGVEDVVMKKFTHGPGSFTIIPLFKSSNYIDIANITSVVERTCSFGEKFIVKRPLFRVVKMEITLVFNNAIDSMSKQLVRNQVKSNLISYINSLKLGESIITNEISQQVMQVDDRIVNFSISKYKIDDKESLYINQSCKWDEKFIVSSDSNYSIEVF